MKTIHKRQHRLLVQNLLAARQAAGMTQRDAAKKFGCGQDLIVRLEAGERRIDVIELKQFAEIYGVAFTKLLPW